VCSHASERRYRSRARSLPQAAFYHVIAAAWLSRGCRWARHIRLSETGRSALAAAPTSPGKQTAPLSLRARLYVRWYGLCRREAACASTASNAKDRVAGCVDACSQGRDGRRQVRWLEPNTNTLAITPSRSKRITSARLKKHVQAAKGVLDPASEQVGGTANQLAAGRPPVGPTRCGCAAVRRSSRQAPACPHSHASPAAIPHPRG
jgi:hypothetical protein